MRTCLTVLMVIFLALVTGMVHAGPPATAPATQPSKLAAERTEGLKKDNENFMHVLDYHALKNDIKNFTLRLSYYGEEDKGKPYYRLFLTVPLLPPHSPMPVDKLDDVHITEDQATKIIDYLATEGFLDRAVPATDERVLPRGPGYLMSLSDGLWESLGWGLPMLQRLDGLRTVLDGDAAKNMDILLGRLAGEPVSSKAVEKNGLSVIVTVRKMRFPADEQPSFTVTFKNTSDKDFSLYDVENFWNWSIRFEQGGNRPWRLLRIGMDHIDALTKSTALKAGKSFAVTVDLAHPQDRFEYVWEGKQGKEVPPLERLDPGSHKLVIAMDLKGNPAGGKPLKEGDEWTGTITTDPVEFEISAKAAATQPMTRTTDAIKSGTTEPPTPQPRGDLTLDDFRKLRPEMTLQQVYAQVGPPVRDMGSGLYILVYTLSDGTTVLVTSTGRKIVSVRYKSGQDYVDLLKPNSTQPTETRPN